MIPLRDVHSVVKLDENETKRKHCFQILTSRRSYCLGALSAEEMEEWMRAINERLSVLTEKPNLTVVIPLKFVTKMGKLKMALVYPNAITLATQGNEVKNYLSPLQILFYNVDNYVHGKWSK